MQNYKKIMYICTQSCNK